MATMLALSPFTGAAVVGRSASWSPAVPRRRALLVRAQTEPDAEPTKETTTSASTSSPSPTPSPSTTLVAPKPKSKAANANPSVWDALAFSGPAPERINGRLAMGQSVESKSSGVWTADAELWNGRFAMLGLVALAVTEFITGTSFVNV
ncbi:unnamed protein product [Triticum turgidum subsp. durum]|uniref:High light inducible protein n=1 Tax=Triticum turgidum subsp. durum TaxID=4567 RepID=A0A9R0T806_TRITD|nr:unnamed protein product [Triticum turgidum subsp. durum]